MTEHVAGGTTGRSRLGRWFLGIGGAAILAVAADALWVLHTDLAAPVLTLMFGAVSIVGIAIYGLWYQIDRLVLRPLPGLAGATRVLCHGTTRARVPADRFALLQPLPDAINELADRLARIREDNAAAIARSVAAAEEQQQRLAAVLRDISEGILMCNQHHQIMLYNQAALKLLHLSGDLGLGRDLLQIIARQPVLHTLERLMLRLDAGRHHDHPMGTGAQFVAATTDGRYLLQGRMNLVLQDDDSVVGYVLTMTDSTAELAALGKRDALLRQTTDGFRGPIANMRAIAEILNDNPDVDPGLRQNFEHLVLAECTTLAERLERVTAEYRQIITGLWPMSDIHSGNLITLIIARARTSRQVKVTMTGLQQWLHGDSYSLVLLFDHLIGCIAEHRAQDAGTLAAPTDLDLSVEADGQWINLDISWSGQAIPAPAIDRWLTAPLADALGGLTVGDVLQHHRSDIWSETLEDGRARLRAPLPPAEQAHGGPPARPPLNRPEFFDFALINQPLPTGSLAQRTLKSLTYVVFDTETTGLRPSDGDEIIAIAGVRIVNGRILTGETFSQLVDPGRPITPDSIQFHGITDDMVRGRPRIASVLRQFRTFVDGAVLVAHNAAFDMKFLRLKEQAAGVRFDNPILDTMLLSRLLQGEEGDHSLDGIANRLGIEIVDRHTALGDALVTAAILLRFVDMLADRGVVTLEQAITEARIHSELRARERAF
ncbi:MAG: exonuclease domain-containing protein [Azospirillaceae bacterium]|nr:exonuclease domain-containing protein [Azospirillaceae bacterium]